MTLNTGTGYLKNPSTQKMPIHIQLTSLPSISIFIVNNKSVLIIIHIWVFIYIIILMVAGHTEEFGSLGGRRGTYQTLFLYQ